MKKLILIILLSQIVMALSSCSSLMQSDIDSRFKRENREFLEGEGKGKEVFRVLLSSDSYEVAQLRSTKSIERVPDKGGDKYVSHELKKLNMIDEARKGVISVWLYPDSGRIMKIRPQQPTYFKEIDSLINDDIMRWNFKFPKKYIEPTRFDIVYRVVLRKKQSDEEIIKEVQQRMKEGE